MSSFLNSKGGECLEGGQLSVMAIFHRLNFCLLMARILEAVLYCG